jgi:hypothetical protein
MRQCQCKALIPDRISVRSQVVNNDRLDMGESVLVIRQANGDIPHKGNSLYTK